MSHEIHFLLSWPSTVSWSDLFWFVSYVLYLFVLLSLHFFPSLFSLDFQLCSFVDERNFTLLSSQIFINASLYWSVQHSTSTWQHAYFLFSHEIQHTFEKSQTSSSYQKYWKRGLMYAYGKNSVRLVWNFWIASLKFFWIFSRHFKEIIQSFNQYKYVQIFILFFYIDNIKNSIVSWSIMVSWWLLVISVKLLFWDTAIATATHLIFSLYTAI